MLNKSILRVTFLTEWLYLTKPGSQDLEFAELCYFSLCLWDILPSRRIYEIEYRGGGGQSCRIFASQNILFPLQIA
jgi:hypothetical protein